MSKELVQRNNDIYRQKVIDHKSYKEISNEYGISETRIRQILEQVRISKQPQNKPTNLLIDEIEKACSFYKANAQMRGRIYNALASDGYLKRHKWVNLSEFELLEIHNLGPVAIQIIKKAQEIASSN